MTDKQINRWLRRQFSPVGWLLMVYYGLMTLLTSVTLAVDAARESLWAMVSGDFSGNLNWDKIYSNGWGYIAAILVCVSVFHAWKGNTYWKQEILAREKRMEGKTFLFFLLFCMGAQMVNSLWVTLLELLMNAFDKSVMPVLEAVAGSSDTFSMFLYASIFAPVWEELLFRGYVLRTLRPFGKRFAVLCSALLFGLFHGNLLQTPYAVIMGLILGYVTVEYSILWSVLLHMFNNLVLADLWDSPEKTRRELCLPKRRVDGQTVPEMLFPESWNPGIDGNDVCQYAHDALFNMTNTHLHVCRWVFCIRGGKLLLAVFLLLCYNILNYADNRVSLPFSNVVSFFRMCVYDFQEAHQF